MSNELGFSIVVPVSDNHAFESALFANKNHAHYLAHSVELLINKPVAIVEKAGTPKYNGDSAIVDFALDSLEENLSDEIVLGAMQIMSEREKQVFLRNAELMY